MKLNDKINQVPRNILILEDEPLMNELVMYYCKRLPFEADIRSYQDPLSALRDPRLDQNSLDLIVADVLLPQMNALEFLENVRKRTGEHFPRVIAITAIANDYLIHQLQQQFGVQFLRKPFRKQDFLSLALELLHVKAAA